MDVPRPSARYACLSFLFGLGWLVLTALIFGWLHYLITNNPWAGLWAGPMLILGWILTGLPAIVFGIVSLLRRESSGRGWYLALIGLMMGLLGPALVLWLRLLS
jgi:hypothetical protein